MTRPLRVVDTLRAVEPVCRQFCADHGIPAIYMHDLTGPLIAEIHALLDRRAAEAYEDGVRAGTEAAR